MQGSKLQKKCTKASTNRPIVFLQLYSQIKVKGRRRFLAPSF